MSPHLTRTGHVLRFHPLPPQSAPLCVTLALRARTITSLFCSDLPRPPWLSCNLAFLVCTLIYLHLSCHSGSRTLATLSPEHGKHT